MQIFVPLYKGTVHSLLRQPHRCFENPSAPESWVPSFISQTLDGLAFIHKHGMVHRNIKPENILYDKGAPNNTMAFYISNFSLTVPKEFVGGVRGGTSTLSFMAPETTRDGECDSASDVYSFGVTLLEVLGKYCVSESRLSVDEWRAKLKAFNAKYYASYRDTVVHGAQLPKMQPGHSRIQSLVDSFVVRRSLKYVLEQDPRLRATASDACRKLLIDYPLCVNGRHQRREAAPQPRREVALQLQREAAPQPRREVALQLQREVVPRPQREVALRIRREVAPQPRKKVALRIRREAAPQPQKKVALQLRREVAPQFRRVVVLQSRRGAAPRPRRGLASRPRIMFERRSEEDNLRPIIIDVQPRRVKPRAGPRLEQRLAVVAIPFRPR